MHHIIRTIDAHVGGQPVRLVVDGSPAPSGATLARRIEWMRRKADYVRRSVVLEPRGHGDTLAALFTDAVTPGTHAGIVFMAAQGYPPMSGHGLIAAVTIAIERGLVFARDAGDGDVRLAFDTMAGRLLATARVHRRGDVDRVDSVAFTSVPAFVHTPGYGATIGGRPLRVDIAYGGQFCAIVDTEAVGIPLSASRVPDLRRLAVDIAAAVNAAEAIVHPTVPSTSGLAIVVFTGPAQDPEAHLRTVTITAGGALNRSPSGTGMAAVMSVLDAMGLLPEGGPFVQEGLAGAIFRGRVTSRTQVGDVPAMMVEIEGTAWITGEATVLVDEDDPWRDGFTL